MMLQEVKASGRLISRDLKSSLQTSRGGYGEVQRIRDEVAEVDSCVAAKSGTTDPFSPCFTIPFAHHKFARKPLRTTCRIRKVPLEGAFRRKLRYQPIERMTGQHDNRSPGRLPGSVRI